MATGKTTFPRLGSPELIAKKVGRRLRRDREGVLEPPLPPVCPPGWRTAPPDFVGIGGQRCGTTRWFRLLESHPKIVPSPVSKELHFFDRFYSGELTAADAEEYSRYFPRDDECRTGEWTPSYVAAPWLPAMLARAAPDARLLVLLRDPVERYLSGLQHNVWVAEQANLPLSRHAPIEAFARGFYHAQLSNWLRCFDRSQLLVLQFERCAAEPLSELRRTLEFIGVSSEGFDPDLEAHPNHQPSKPTLAPELRKSYVSAYAEDVKRLASEFPEIDLSLWPNFAQL